MNDYISGNIKIIKLHGSHDWIYINRTSNVEREFFDIKNSFDLCQKNPDFIDEIKKKEFAPIHFQELNSSKEKSDFNWFPAIAIPLIGKDRYILPKNHIQVFEKNLPTVDRVLIIGWRAGDPLLLEILKNYLPQMGYQVLIVSDTLGGAELIAKTVRKGLNVITEGTVSIRGDGFSGFVSDEISNTFFSL